MRKNAMILLAAAVVMLPLTSCTTAYDAYGRPVQTVDPGAAVAAAAAVGVAGYAIGRNNNSNHHYGGYGYPYYPRHRPGRW